MHETVSLGRFNHFNTFRFHYDVTLLRSQDTRLLILQNPVIKDGMPVPG